MYKISDFSKITNLTAKTLRYYDEEGILVPSYRDTNSYRYYDENDFQKAQLIALLRELDFSISEIKDVLANYECVEDLAYFLEEKKSMIMEKIEREKALIKKLDLYTELKKTEVNSMNYQIEIKEFEPVTVASIRYKGRYSDVGKYIGTIYKAVKGRAAGAPFNCYYDAEYVEEADVEICVPTKGLIESQQGVTAKKLPKIKAICATHTGSYETLNLAYKALLDYASEHNIECKTPSREIYIKGPGMVFKGNPNKYVTEIVMPFE